MKVIAYMAITANGLIATETGDSSWVSTADENNFRELAKSTGNIVMGRGTYDYLVEAKAFPIPDTLNVVLTSSAPNVEPLKNVVFEDKSPEEVIEQLKGMGFEQVLLGGGGELLGSFMTDGLIDELILTVEPLVFAEGKKLFEFGDFRRELELLEVKKLSEHEVQLRYAVRKHTLEDVLEAA